MTVLVTGSAGFIGFYISKKLLDNNFNVIGIDSINEYYDIKLKTDRLNILSKYSNFKFHKVDISNLDELNQVYKKNIKFDFVIHLAAQAGVRYSIEKPFEYQKSNLEGFLNILEMSRNYNIKKLIYASSSSVYGNSTNEILTETDLTDIPISLYAATKKSNELMAHTYSHLYNIQTIGLRFFTVYGPWGRPDMAYFKFLNILRTDKYIEIYNNGDLYRDFTYIDDIVDGIYSTISYNTKGSHIFNLGNNNPVKLIDFINTIENIYGKVFLKSYVDMQPGDVYKTYANINKAKTELGYMPKVDLKSGLTKFINWYKDYYK